MRFGYQVFVGTCVLFSTVIQASPLSHTIGRFKFVSDLPMFVYENRGEVQVGPLLDLMSRQLEKVFGTKLEEDGYSVRDGKKLEISILKDPQFSKDKNSDFVCTIKVGAAVFPDVLIPQAKSGAMGAQVQWAMDTSDRLSVIDFAILNEGYKPHSLKYINASQAALEALDMLHSGVQELYENAHEKSLKGPEAALFNILVILGEIENGAHRAAASCSEGLYEMAGFGNGILSEYATKKLTYEAKITRSTIADVKVKQLLRQRP